MEAHQWHQNVVPFSPLPAAQRLHLKIREYQCEEAAWLRPEKAQEGQLPISQLTRPLRKGSRGSPSA